MFTDEIANVSDRRVWYYPVSSSFEFQLRTCENAQIRLAEIPKQETTNGYDISLSNTLSSIKKTSDTSIQVTKDTPKLLDCIVLRKFWITWSQGVKVGTGKLNSEVLLELQDSASIQIAAISVTTPVPSYLGGEWQVRRDMGRCYHCLTKVYLPIGLNLEGLGLRPPRFWGGGRGVYFKYYYIL